MTLSGDRFLIKILPSAKKDKDLIKSVPALKKRVDSLLEVLAANPYQNPPPYEKLIGNLKGFYSRRINAQHRLVYEVDETQHMVRIISMWTQYEK